MTNAIANASDYRAALLAAIEARSAIESAKSADNDSAQKTLKDIRKNIDNDHISQVMFSSNVDANLLTSSERVGANFSMYAYQKIVSTVRCIASTVNTLDHRIEAVLKTALSLAKADLVLNHEDAQFALLKLEKHTDRNKRALIVTTSKLLSKATANSQSSQCVNALQRLSVFTETRDANNKVAYAINFDHANTKALLANIEAHA